MCIHVLNSKVCVVKLHQAKVEVEYSYSGRLSRCLVFSSLNKGFMVCLNQNLSPSDVIRKVFCYPCGGCMGLLS